MAKQTGLLLVIFLLAACAGKSDENDGALGIDRLRNASYPLLGTNPLRTVRLVEGEFIDEGTRVRAILGENWIAHGDLDGDGREDAAVVLYYDTGGSGNFREFLVLGAADEEVRVLGGSLVGDRVKIESFTIADGEVVAQMIVHAADDPFCCPTLRVQDRYTLRDGALVRSERRELGRVEP